MNMDISTIIKMRRAQLGMTKKELSIKSGMSRATILIVENQGRQPMFNHGVALLESLGMEVVIREKV
jgi:transcriptional regulator with XRE-family HTH domain